MIFVVQNRAAAKNLSARLQATHLAFYRIISQQTVTPSSFNATKEANQTVDEVLTHLRKKTEADAMHL